MPDTGKNNAEQAIARYLADDKIEHICKAIGGSKAGSISGATATRLTITLGQRAHEKTEDHPGQNTQNHRTGRRVPAACLPGGKVVVLRPSSRGSHSGLVESRAQRTIYRILHRHQKEVT